MAGAVLLCGPDAMVRDGHAAADGLGDVHKETFLF